MDYIVNNCFERLTFQPKSSLDPTISFVSFETFPVNQSTSFEQEHASIWPSAVYPASSLLDTFLLFYMSNLEFTIHFLLECLDNLMIRSGKLR